MNEFEKIYRKHVNAVFRFALQLVRNRALAEDITSETFLILYRNQEQVDDSRVQSWLFTVARNRARDHWRQMATERKYIENSVVDNTAVANTQEFENWLLEARSLKPVHRTCLILRYIYGMTRPEIAQQTGMDDHQIKSALQYALQLLRKEFAGSIHERNAV